MDVDQGSEEMNLELPEEKENNVEDGMELVEKDAESKEVVEINPKNGENGGQDASNGKAVKRSFPGLFKPQQRPTKKLKSAASLAAKSAVVTLNELKPGLAYKVLEMTGPVHMPIFRLEVEVNGEKYQGSGRSKKEAKHDCAAKVLQSFIQFKNTETANQAYMKNKTGPYGYPGAQNSSSWDFTSDQSSLVTTFEQKDANAAKGEPVAKKPKMSSAENIIKSGAPLNDKNPVMLLNELKPGLTYDVSESGDSPATKRFIYKVKIDEQVFEGSGASKKLAKRAAARGALTKLYNLNFTPQLPSGAAGTGAGGSEAVIPGTTVPVADFSLPQGVADKIGQLVLEKFGDLMKGRSQHSRRKVLAGIVMTSDPEMTRMKIISVTTGTKCVNGEHMSVNGRALNDCHAEIVSRRCLLEFLYRQIEILSSSTKGGEGGEEGEKNGGKKPEEAEKPAHGDETENGDQKEGDKNHEVEEEGREEKEEEEEED